MDIIDELIKEHEKGLDLKDKEIADLKYRLSQYEQQVPKINVIDGVPNTLNLECCGGINLKGVDENES